MCFSPMSNRMVLSLLADDVVAMGDFPAHKILGIRTTIEAGCAPSALFVTVEL